MCCDCARIPQREAADTRSPSGEDALEARTECTPPVHPEVCSGCNQTIKTHVTCVGPAVATSDWECRSRSACCPRRDVVRGWQYRDGLCFWRHQDLKRLANMGGERGAVWMMNARDKDVCCFDCGRIAHPPVVDLARTLHVASNMAGTGAPSTKNFKIGHVCGSLPMALEKRTARCFIHFWNCFQLLCWCSFGVPPSMSSAPCQTLTTQTKRSWKAVSKANGEHSKRTHLGATCFERVHVIFFV